VPDEKADELDERPPDPSGSAGWIDEVRRRLAAWERKPVPPPPQARRAAVLVPLYVRDGALWTVFTLRTDSLEHHRGQISFPGGGHEPEDTTLYHTALREADEELGIRTEVTDFYVEPFVVALPWPYEWKPQAAEIAEVIEVPIAALMRPEALEKRHFEGREEAVLFYRYGNHVIWGATGRILSELLAALEEPEG
jgi:8-oxo-dGTP pyrophosphatase MutT (NUDIX family)